MELLQSRLDIIQHCLVQVISHISKNLPVKQFVPSNNDFTINNLVKLIKAELEKVSETNQQLLTNEPSCDDSSDTEDADSNTEINDRKTFFHIDTHDTANIPEKKKYNTDMLRSAPSSILSASSSPSNGTDFDDCGTTDTEIANALEICSQANVKASEKCFHLDIFEQLEQELNIRDEVIPILNNAPENAVLDSGMNSPGSDTFESVSSFSSKSFFPYFEDFNNIGNVGTWTDSSGVTSFEKQINFFNEHLQKDSDNGQPYIFSNNNSQLSRDGDHQRCMLTPHSKHLKISHQNRNQTLNEDFDIMQCDVDKTYVDHIKFSIPSQICNSNVRGSSEELNLLEGCFQ